MSSPELLKFLLVRNVINSPRKLSHTVNVSKKFQAVTPDLAHQVQGELAANLIYSKPGLKQNIELLYKREEAVLSRKQGVEEGEYGKLPRQ